MKEIKLGLGENRSQFTLLVIVNAFVGGMVGLERSILPEIATQEFMVAANIAVLSFIIVFGIVKAITNYYAGALSNKYGRKKLLILGWLFGIPVPIILIYAPDWNWIIAANILLGINQGLAWSSTVIMKIDLVGEKQRGLAMGINEFAGYLAVGIVAFLTGWIAHDFGPRPYPFYLGIGLAVTGLFLSIFFVKDTRKHASIEAIENKVARLKHVFWDTTVNHRNLSSVTQAGLINNLNDGMIWGIFPILLTGKLFSPRTNWHSRGCLPGGLGYWSIIHRKNGRPLSEKKAAEYWNVVASHCLTVDDLGRFLCAIYRFINLPGMGDSNGLPYISCHRGRQYPPRRSS